MNVENSVIERYSAGAHKREEALCCPVSYDPGLLKNIPAEIIEKDYGCGDPSPYVRSGDVVLDLGSGGGKVCYLAAQLTGPKGRVIGVDMNDDMLALARKYQAQMAEKLGSDRVSFRKGQIQNLALDLEALDAYLQASPVSSQGDYQRLRNWELQQCIEQPLIADASVDLVISNCVLNLVRDEDKQQLVQEIFRVLKPGGRVAISDIISDKPCSAELKRNPELWSGCLSGAFQEQEFLQAFVDAGFSAVRYEQWDDQVWQVVEGIEFRSALLTAVKGEEESQALDRDHVVLYRGPHAQVQDDEGTVYPRGVRKAVSERTFALLTCGAYGQDFIAISPDSTAQAGGCCSPGTRSTTVESGTKLPHDQNSTSGCCG